MTRRFVKALSLLAGAPVEAWRALVTQMPGPLGRILRVRYWRRRVKRMGKNVRIDVGVHIVGPEHVTLDDGVWLDRGVVLMAGAPREGRVTSVRPNPDFPLAIGEVYLGKNVHVAEYCVLSGMGGLHVGLHSGIAGGTKIYSYSHHYRNASDKDDPHQYSFAPGARDDQQSMLLSPVFIGDYCGVGLNSVLLPGVTLRRGTWVASQTVVTGSFPEQSLVYEERTLKTKPLTHLRIKE